MSEFIFLYRTTEAEQVENMGTPEMAQQRMQAWLGWMRELEGHPRDQYRSRGADDDSRDVRRGRRHARGAPCHQRGDPEAPVLITLPL